MKKQILLFSTLLCISFNLIAQFGSQQIISTEAAFAFRAIPHDIDNDGFIDVVSGSSNKIVWYKNQDGLGLFSAEKSISEGIPALEGIALFDLDSDGDLDVLYKTYPNKIAWLKNLDGQGTFGTEQIIADTNYPHTINVADIDGDGDNDIFVNLYDSSSPNRLVWYKNLDGLGNFGDEILIEAGDFDRSKLLLFDLDNDGDLDLISSYEYYDPSTLIWYENLDSQGSFSGAKEIFQFQHSSDWTSIHKMTNSDINGDGKIDILVATYHDDLPDYIYWLENIDENGLFSEPKYIHTNETTLGSLRTYDIDNDGDNDVLVSFYYGAASKIAWFENLDGLGNFSEEKIISTEVDRATDATAADINGDQLPDVISASSFDNTIAWYENGVLGIEDNTENHFKLYPNPTNGELLITNSQEIILIEVYNLVGQKVLETKNNINLSNLVSGIYFVNINDENGFSEIHKIIKK